MSDEIKYPSNSLMKKPSEPKTAQKSEPPHEMKGKIKTRQKTVWQKLAGAFMPDDIHSVLDHIVYGMAIPKLKEAIYSTVGYLLNIPGANKKTDDGKHTDYTSFSKGKAADPYPTLRTIGVDVYFENSEDAWYVLGQMKAMIHDDGFVSVYRYYRLAKMETDYSKQNYGWYDLSDSGVAQNEDGYYLRLPKPTILRRA